MAGRSGRAELALSAERSVYVIWGLLVIASAALMRALLAHDFSIEYVAAVHQPQSPGVLHVVGVLRGAEGVAALLGGRAGDRSRSVALLLNRGKYRELMPYVAAVLLITVTFFVAAMVFASNPFERLGFTPPDGRGLNPQLQNPGMVIHPPMLYLGYISIAIPFAFAIAALLLGQARHRLAQRHPEVDHPLVAVPLASAIVLGMWWAYVELGWGGYWAWDPVENASLMPWLTMTAFLHSVMIQEKRGMLKKWNLGLIIASFLLSIFGTFITRSGVISSVHASRSRTSAGSSSCFLVLAGIGSFTLLVLPVAAARRRAKLESMVSREAAFLFNNLIFVVITFSVFWGTLFPVLSEAVRGTKVTVGPPFFNQVNVPLGLLLLLFLTGVGPLIAWRQAARPTCGGSSPCRRPPACSCC